MLLYALNFVLTFFHRLLMSESGVVQPFLANESGFISSRRGLPVAWTVGVLVVASALLGAPETVRADDHYCGSVGGTSNCEYRCIMKYGCPKYATCGSLCKCFCSEGTPSCN